MSIATLNFAATLPTYTKLGANGTTFANDTLSAFGGVLVNTNDSATGQPSVLASGFSANGLNYNFNSYSLSGDTLSVFYNLSSDASTDQQNEASDINTALADNLPENQTNFTYAGGAIDDTFSSAVYNVATAGVNGVVPTTTGQAAATVVGSNGSDGTTLGLESISTGPDDTIEVTFSVNTDQAQSAPPAPSNSAPTGSTSSGFSATASGTASTVGLLAGNLLAENTNQALGPKNIAQAISNNANDTNPGALLAGLLNPISAQQVSIYNVVTAFGSGSSSGNTVNTYA